MKCRDAFAVVLGLAIVGAAYAIPARPLSEPTKPAPAVVPPAVLLPGTEWNGKYNLANRIFIFEADGTLSYRTGAGKLGTKDRKNAGTWRVDGNTLHFTHALTPTNVIMEFRGVIRDAQTIVGEATYPLLGKKDTQTLQRGAK